MIEHVLKPFDWVVQMPIEDQCRYSIGMSLAGFLIAAFLREYCTDRHIRLAARALGAAAFFAVAAFAVHATKQVDKLESIVASNRQKASEIASESVLTVMTASGHTIDFGEMNNGVRGILRSSRRSGNSVRSKDDRGIGSGIRLSTSSMGYHGCDGSVDYGVHDVARLYEQSERWWRWWHDAIGSGCFELPEQVEGKTF